MGGEPEHPGPGELHYMVANHSSAAFVVDSALKPSVSDYSLVESGEVTPALLQRLAAERDRIDYQVSELLSARDKLDNVIATAEKPGPGCTRVYT